MIAAINGAKNPATDRTAIYQGYAKHVIGVELNRDAIKDAISNAKRNHIHNVTFYNEDAGQFMVEDRKSVV